MGDGLIQAGSPSMPQPATVSDRLKREEQDLTERLAKVKSLRTVLAANPEVQAVMDGLSELGQYHY